MRDRPLDGGPRGKGRLSSAIDAAPEALSIARDRVREADVTFIFFSAWLSHVPTTRFDEFWHSLQRLLRKNGRVLLIDEHVDVRDKEAYVADRDEVVERRLNDGTTHHVIKNFVDLATTERRLRELGWECVIRRDGSDWVYGEARPAS